MNYENELVKFIMSMSNEEFDAWSDASSLEEVNQAIQAIQQERIRIAELKEYLEEEELQNLSDARDILGQFTLRGLN